VSGPVGAGGVAIDLPTGWDGRARSSSGAPSSARAAAAPARGVVLHAGSFALPAQVAEYGSGAVERMTASDVLLCLVEHDPDDIDRALFRRRRVPVVRAQDFDPQGMQRAIPGMSGAQWFFRAADRAFCLYAVLGSHRARRDLAPRLAAVVDTLQIS
jgi:hypothetical protein